MKPSLPEALLRLREEYVRELPGRVSELVRAVEALQEDDAGEAALQKARSLAHQLHGTAGSYGLSGIGDVAGMIERALKGGDDASGAAAGLATRLLDALRELPAGALPEALARPTHTGPRLLVCSTDGELLRALSELGRAQLWEVLAVAQPEEALEAAARMRPDAALLDLPLSLSGDATGLLEQLHALPFGLPVALVTAGASVNARVLASHAGARLCVEKPVDPPQLGLLLEALFAESRARREPLRVLVLRESPPQRDQTLSLLRAARIAAEPINEPAALMEALEQRRPDALVLGDGLASLPGANACRAVRTALRWRDLPILLIGSSESPEARLRAVEAGADAWLVEPVDGAVLAARLQSLVLRARVQRERADTDALTGLLLRRPFLERLATRIFGARRNRQPLAVCLLDLDGFKETNHRMGHLGADRLLAAFGRTLLGTFRMEDLRCRWGGDEFALTFPGQNAEAALGLLARLLPLAAAIELDGALAPVPFSAGIAAFPADGADAAELLRVADQRLFHAKAAGRGRLFAN